MQPKRPKLIVFSGMDGAGKSKHAHALVDELSQRGLRVVYRRLRFPFVTSVPLLLYARLRGWSYEVRQGGYAIRAHAFGSSPALRLLYPLTAFLDLLLATTLLIRLPLALGWTVVCDRFVLDTLVDVASSCNKASLAGFSWSRLYEALTPPGATTILLKASEATLKHRRMELSIDPSFTSRYALYQDEAEARIDHSVGTEDDFQPVHDRILRLVTEAWSPSEPTWRHRRLSSAWYGSIKRSALPRFWKRTLLLLTHWLFQSVGSMGRTERALKAALWILVFVPGILLLAGPIGLLPASLVAAILSHSTNFLLNAHVAVALKYLDRRVGETTLYRYTETLGKRVHGRQYLEGAVVVGSLARDALRPTSDVDVRIIPKPGALNALRAGLFVMGERTRALRRMIPLDIYLAENPETLGIPQEGENPRILIDNRGLLDATLGGLANVRPPT